MFNYDKYSFEYYNLYKNKALGVNIWCKKVIEIVVVNTDFRAWIKFKIYDLESITFILNCDYYC